MSGPHAPMRYDQRQKAASRELAQWREHHPQFTSQELLDAWRTLRQTWKLMENHPKGARR